MGDYFPYFGKTSFATMKNVAYLVLLWFQSRIISTNALCYGSFGYQVESSLKCVFSHLIIELLSKIWLSLNVKAGTFPTGFIFLKSSPFVNKSISLISTSKLFANINAATALAG